MADERLEAYRARRSARSPEPKGRRGPSRKPPIFVVQEHEASTHHFDFRIEVDGVLKSWAVPKGPSTDPRAKRLAVAVEDHPLDYADFEGVIPEGEYGGGAVIVWDRGTYDNLTEKKGRLRPVADALADGHLMIALHGQKLSGGYALQRISGGEKAKWLLIKMKDDDADARRRPTSTRPRSVVSGRTVKQLAAARDEDAARSATRRVGPKRPVMNRQVTDVEGRRVKLSNVEKVLFPAAGLTKGDLIEYYERVAPVMLPHLAGRPLSLQRYPDGIDAEGFMQKNASDYFPGWIRRARLAKQDGDVAHVVADSAATLVYLANQACVTLHVGLSRTDRIDHPDRMVLDLDPSDDDFEKVRRAARDARALLEEVGLVPFLQTTGSRGLHLWVPLDRSADFDEVRAFAGRLAEVLEARRPAELTTAQRKAKRGDRVLLDVARNAYAQTAVAPYSVRARPPAPVATPLAWAELDDPKLEPQRYTIKNLFRRLGQRGDPWAEIDRHARGLKAAAERLMALAG